MSERSERANRHRLPPQRRSLVLVISELVDHPRRLHDEPSTSATCADRRSPARPPQLRWWKELGYIVAFYLVYSFIRNQFGSEAVSADTAFANARKMIDLERALASYYEETVQQGFLDDRWFIQFWNLFYGTFHFVVTAAAHHLPLPPGAVALRALAHHAGRHHRPGPDRLRHLPPHAAPPAPGVVRLRRHPARLRRACGRSTPGPCRRSRTSTRRCPACTSPGRRGAPSSSPRRCSRPWAKALAVAYPVATLFAIVVTGNHFWIDAAGGAVILGLGWLAGSWWDRRTRPRTASSALE